ncbi:MAG: glycosyltransferase family 2 protein [Chlamydiales bacterium]
MISVTILVKNGERHLFRVLEALKRFDQVVVYDSGSQDDTLKIARTFPNVVIYEGPFEGFGVCHNKAASLARHDWILSIDADEVLSPALTDEILRANLKPNTVYSLPFQNYYRNRRVKWCGWYPEQHVRLYHKKRTAFSTAMIHEGVIEKGMCKAVFVHPVAHYSYDNISDFLVKMERYSTLFARQYQGKKKSSPLIACYHGVGGFMKSYWLKKGFLSGYHGFLISMAIGHTAFYKYLKLYELNKD